MPSAAQLDITPQGLRYARKFWPSFTKRWKSLHLRLGRSFLQGPEALGDWRLDQTSPFERTRILNTAPDRSAIAATLAKVRATYPALAGVQAAQSWAGWIDMTPDAVPVIGPIATLPGLYLAAGFSGHGFGIGPAAGQPAADLVAGRVLISSRERAGRDAQEFPRAPVRRSPRRHKRRGRGGWRSRRRAR